MKLRKFTDTGHAKYVLLYNKIKESVIKNNGDIKKGYTKVLKDEIEDLKNDISYSKEVLSGKNLKILMNSVYI